MIFLVKPEDNPGAFTHGVNYDWATFQIGTEVVNVKSHGEQLCAFMNEGTDRSIQIFSVTPPNASGSAHVITVQWSPEILTLRMDGVTLHEMAISDFM